MKQTLDKQVLLTYPTFQSVRSNFLICNFISFFNGGMNENGQPSMSAMSAMAELLNCTSHGCNATVGAKLCSVPGRKPYKCLSCVQSQEMKHEFKSIDDPNDNLTPLQQVML